MKEKRFLEILNGRMDRETLEEILPSTFSLRIAPLYLQRPPLPHPPLCCSRLAEVEWKNTEEGEAFYRVTRRRSTSQGGKSSSLTCPESEGPNLAVMCIYSLGGFPFRRPWVPKLGTHVPRLKLTKKTQQDSWSTTGMIGPSEE
jgi:hypothetical protein